MSGEDIYRDGGTMAGGTAAEQRSVTAFFDTREAADKAQQDLLASGIPTGDIRVAGGEATASESAPPQHGFWESLKEFFLPEADRHLYAEGLRRGGFAVSVNTDGGAYDAVIDLLDRDGAVDMEERSAGWRDDGWTGSDPSAAWAAEERAFTPPSAGTAGFGASMADQPLVGAPVTTGEIEPGLVTDLTEDRMRAQAAAPDTAYAAGAPGLGDTSRDTTRITGRAAARPLARPHPDPLLSALRTAEQIDEGKAVVNIARPAERREVVLARLRRVAPHAAARTASCIVSRTSDGCHGFGTKRTCGASVREAMR